MNNWQDLFKGPPESWLTALPEYQQQLAATLLSTTASTDEAAQKWLSAAPSNTFPFGGIRTKPYFDKLLEELEAFICGDPKYQADRLKLAAESKPTQAFVVGAISVSIAPMIGTSAPIVAPVIVLLLMTTGKLGVNAWCSARKELRAQHQAAEQQRVQGPRTPTLL